MNIYKKKIRILGHVFYMPSDSQFWSNIMMKKKKKAVPLVDTWWRGICIFYVDIRIALCETLHFHKNKK